jgi:DNA helicase-2/ATP-dependent DNA helicase PcrA
MLESETKKFPQNDTLINHFVVYMNRHKESFTAEGFQRRLEYGIEILSNYYAKYQSAFPKIVSLEKNIKNVVIAGVPLKGKLDKIEFEGHRVNIVDYKSGDPERGVKKISGPSEKEPDGGNYWRQAVFYKLLVDNDSTQSWITESVEFDFIEPDKNKNYIRNKITIQNSDMTTVTHQIKNTWNRIQAHDFYKGCGKKTCYWCHFVAQNNMVAKWHQPEDDDTQPEY